MTSLTANLADSGRMPAEDHDNNPSMPRFPSKRGVCGVCCHPRRAVIELALAQGQAQQVVARVHGLSKFSVHRHWHSHVAETHKAALRLGSEITTINVPKLREAMRDNTLPDLLDLKARLWEALDRARDQGDLKHTSALIGRAINLEQAIATVTGQLRSDAVAVSSTININIYGELRTGLVGVLRAHPEAREAILGYLRIFDEQLARLEAGAPVSLSGVVGDAA